MMDVEIQTQKHKARRQAMNRFQDAREAIKYSSQNDTIAVCEPSCKDFELRQKHA